MFLYDILYAMCLSSEYGGIIPMNFHEESTDHARGGIDFFNLQGPANILNLS